jgi:hypothetical protein
MTYRKADKSQFTDEEIKVLLEKDGGDTRWKLGMEIIETITEMLAPAG